MERFKTYVASDDGQTYLCETIEHEGALWLVPEWLETPYPRMIRPARIIRLDKQHLRDLGPISEDRSVQFYKLDDPIPKAVLDGRVQSTPNKRFDVREAPDIVVRKP